MLKNDTLKNATFRIGLYGSAPLPRAHTKPTRTQLSDPAKFQCLRLNGIAPLKNCPFCVGRTSNQEKKGNKKIRPHNLSIPCYKLPCSDND